MKITIECYQCEGTGITKVTDSTCYVCNGEKELTGYPEELLSEEQLQYYNRWKDYKEKLKQPKKD